MKRILDDEFEDYFWSKVKINKKNECWPWLGLGSSTRQRYGQLSAHVAKKYGGTTHRIAYALFYNISIDGKLVCHKCDNPLCCNPHHLFLGTHYDNLHDCINKGRFVPNGLFGEMIGVSVLKEKKVKKIFKMYLSQIYSSKEIAKIFSVSWSTVNLILSGRTWKHLNLLENSISTTCKFCNKIFKNLRSLQAHLIMHKKERDRLKNIK